jgi:trimethylamine:corrinoid methyltransferase-like protein
METKKEKIVRKIELMGEQFRFGEFWVNINYAETDSNTMKRYHVSLKDSHNICTLYEDSNVIDMDKYITYKQAINKIENHFDIMYNKLFNEKK